MGTIRSNFFAAVLCVATAFVAGTAEGAATDEQKCQSKLLSAAGKYASCQEKAKAKYETTEEDLTAYQTAASKCVAKYLLVWPKLQEKFAGTGTTCDNARFSDNGQTLTDRLTGLQWEQKQDDSSDNDKDNNYTWTIGTDRASGTAFTAFLEALNAVTCFAGQCDWRLPSREELQTLLAEPFPCTSSPCVAVEIGHTAAAQYFTSDSLTTDPLSVWTVDFSTGAISSTLKLAARSTRAVRGGR